VFDQVFLSSGDLDPARVVSAELGYVGRPWSTLTVDLRLFRDRLTDLISMYTRPYPNIDGDTRDFRNLDRVTLTGSELQLDYRPQRDTRLIFNYANVLVDSTDIDAVYSNTVPRHNLSLLGLHELRHGWQASAAFYYVDRMAYLDEDEQLVGPLRRLDLRLARRFALPGASGEAALVFQNVLNEQASYYVDYADSVTAKAGYLTLSMQTR
jgi:outer membrane receptor protein involved in Fe transport